MADFELDRTPQGFVTNAVQKRNVGAELIELACTMVLAVPSVDGRTLSDVAEVQEVARNGDSRPAWPENAETAVILGAGDDVHRGALKPLQADEGGNVENPRAATSVHCDLLR